MLFFNYKGGKKMWWWAGRCHCIVIFFLPSFADYVSWAPLLADDKQNFHVLCIINPSLPLFMPTRLLSPAHAWIAKESTLQLELIDILKKKKRERERESVCVWGGVLEILKFKRQIFKWINFPCCNHSHLREGDRLSKLKASPCLRNWVQDTAIHWRSPLLK